MAASNAPPETIMLGRGFTTSDETTIKWIEAQPAGSYYLTSEGRVHYHPEEIELGKKVHFHVRLCGGKGGFGSILRSFRINRSTNQNMCRTLSGRRLGDVKEEERLRKWIEKKAEREKAKEAKKRDKLERLKNGGPKHRFDDQAYLRRRDLVLDQVEDAFEAGVRAQQERQIDGEEGLKPAAMASGEDVEAASLQDDEQSHTSPSSGESSSDDDDEGEEEGQSSTSHAARKRARVADDCGESSDSQPTKRQKVDYAAEVVFDYYTEKFVEDIAEAVVAEKQCAGEDTGPIAPPPASTSHANGAEAEKIDYSRVDLDSIHSSTELEHLGMEHLKHELEARGMKCGGTLRDRAARLLSVKGLSPDSYPKSVLKPAAKK